MNVTITNGILTGEKVVEFAFDANDPGGAYTDTFNVTKIQHVVGDGATVTVLLPNADYKLVVSGDYDANMRNAVIVDDWDGGGAPADYATLLSNVQGLL